MCFIIHPLHSVPKIAKTNIRVLKILDDKGTNGLQAPFTKHGYELGKLNKVANIRRSSATIGLGGVIKPQINRGLHSFAPSKKSKYRIVQIIGRAPYNCARKLYTGIIPKGSLYWHNPEMGEYVSNQLIVIKESKKKYNKVIR